MKYKNSTEAILAAMKDAQSYRHNDVLGNLIITFESNYLKASYCTNRMLNQIPEHSADRWQLFAINNELHLSFIYEFEEELA